MVVESALDSAGSPQSIVESMRASAKLIGENPKYKTFFCRFQTISVLGGGDHTAWTINDEIQMRVLTIQLISEHPAAVPLVLGSGTCYQASEVS
jgi:hypothetical protein